MMDIYDDEEALELCEKIRGDRHRPVSLEESGAPKAIWEELRSLAYHNFGGGEWWSEWSALFEALPEAERGLSIEYVAQVWNCPEATLEALHHEFRFKTLSAHVAALRAIDFEVLPPPGTAAQVKAWEQKHHIALPDHLRRFFTEVSTGHDEPSEWFLFDLLAEEGLQPFTKSLDGTDPEVDIYSACLARVLYHCETTGARGAFELPGAFDGMEEARSDDTCATLVQLYGFFEGNHGDLNDFLITSGPLAGTMISWSDMWHNDIETGVVFYGGQHVSDWLLDAYREHVLHEDI